VDVANRANRQQRLGRWLGLPSPGDDTRHRRLGDRVLRRELVADLLGDALVRVAPEAQRENAGVTVGCVAPVRVLGDDGRLDTQAAVELVEVGSGELLEADRSDPGQHVDSHVAGVDSSVELSSWSPICGSQISFTYVA
jgi:hypothetical protein